MQRTGVARVDPDSQPGVARPDQRDDGARRLKLPQVEQLPRHRNLIAVSRQPGPPGRPPDRATRKADRARLEDFLGAR
eukprot:scaffold16638_cov120-Isochrysis_galbana.AAC.7